MSELRLDPTTHEWVVVATERARRPSDFVTSEAKPVPPPFVESCPFCPGNEAQTTHERASYPDPSTGRWRVRVVDNKYPAVQAEGSTRRRHEHPFALSMDGVGAHEVVVETPLHNRHFALFGDDEAFDVVRAFRDRLVALSSREEVRQVIIFKNHGASAGTSLTHPHSQIVATPVVPWHRRHHYDVAMRHYDEEGINLYQDLLDFELEQHARVVADSDGFVEIHPYASRKPFETWIVPRVARSSMSTTPDDELRDFAVMLRDSLWALCDCLNNPDYNFVLYTVPVGDEDEPYYCWHVRIYPRLTSVAGFEIGSGIHINTSLPEESAMFMRELRKRTGMRGRSE